MYDIQDEKVDYSEQKERQSLSFSLSKKSGKFRTFLHRSGIIRGGEKRCLKKRRTAEQQ